MKLYKYQCCWPLYKKFSKYVNWYELSYEHLPIQFVKIFKDKIHIETYCQRVQLLEDEISQLIEIYNMIDESQLSLLTKLIQCQKMSTSFIDNVILQNIPMHRQTPAFFNSIIENQDVSEDFLEKHDAQLDLMTLYSKCAHLVSEQYIDKQLDRHPYSDMIMQEIFSHVSLSEDFIERHYAQRFLVLICTFQILSEDFIIRHYDDISLYALNACYSYQHLSEEFLKSHYTPYLLPTIARFQKMSPELIKDIFHRIHKIDRDALVNIATYQKLNDECIEMLLTSSTSFRNDLLNIIAKYQVISKNLYLKYKDAFDATPNYYLYNKVHDMIPLMRQDAHLKDKVFCLDNNWIYAPTTYKKKTIEQCRAFDCYPTYFIAYKAVRKDLYSLYNFQYRYELGKKETCKCDPTDDTFSFGLSVGTIEYAKRYGDHNSIILKCKVRYEDVGRLVQYRKKVRCNAITPIEIVNI